MTGKEIVSDWWITVLSQDDINATDLRGLAVMIGAALAAERTRCTAVIWEHRGKCASDQAARALMEEMERTPWI